MPSLQDSIFLFGIPRPPFAALTATWAVTCRPFGTKIRIGGPKDRNITAQVAVSAANGGLGSIEQKN